MNDTSSTKNTYSYIIKICLQDNYDYKIIYNCDINNNKIIELLKIYYPSNDLIVCNLCNNPILKNINNRYGFITNKNFDLDTFCENINYFNKFINEDDVFTLLTKVNSVEQKINNDKIIYIYYNYYFNDIVITNIEKPDIFNEFFLIYNNTVNKEQLKELINLQDNVFSNIEIAKYNINKIINKEIINTQLSIFEIKELIHKHFDISQEQNNKIKFSDMWLILLTKQNINETYHKSIKKQLPKALEEMGLSKKRLTNGIYWLGVIKKITN